MTRAHDYKETIGRDGKTYHFIDGIRASEDRWSDSKGKSERIERQFRHANGTIGAVVVERAEAREIQREIREEVETGRPIRRWIIRGIARPKAKSDARTPDLESDHFIETSERISNISEQEELLNEKYDSWVHFDTFIEEVIE